MGAPGTTPQPWIADLHGERMSGGRFIVCVHKPGELVPVSAVTAGVEGYGREEGRANAHQIAASGDLYDALEELLKGVDRLLEKHVWDEDGPIVAKARAALARARGETPHA